jgi:hypothetical protein
MMPKAKHTPTPAEQRKRFEEEIKKRKEAGDFDPEKADAALDDLVRKQRTDSS